MTYHQNEFARRQLLVAYERCRQSEWSNGRIADELFAAAKLVIEGSLTPAQCELLQAWVEANPAPAEPPPAPAPATKFPLAPAMLKNSALATVTVNDEPLIPGDLVDGEPKLTLALPDWDTRRIKILSDEYLPGERLVCVAIVERNADKENGITARG